MTVETVRTHIVEDPAYSIVIPVRNRCGAMIRNCLRSIELQTFTSLELIVVDYGSTDENHEKLMDLLPNCTVYRCKTDDPWSLSIARNIGLRRATAKYSCTLDADLIMEPRALEVAYELHTIIPNLYLSTRVVLIDPMMIDPSTLFLPRDYEKLDTARSTYVSEGWGGFITAPTEWWYKCQGFDERMTIWGWEDVDMWKRAARAGMNRRRLSYVGEWDIAMYHMYHESTPLEAIRNNEKIIVNIVRQNERWTKNYKGITRNDENWGMWT